MDPCRPQSTRDESVNGAARMEYTWGTWIWAHQSKSNMSICVQHWCYKSAPATGEVDNFTLMMQSAPLVMLFSVQANPFSGRVQLLLQNLLYGKHAIA